MNAYEQDGEVVADICVFEDAEIIQDLYLENLRAGKPVADPRVRRFRIDPAAGTVTGERLTDEGFELPRINYGRCNERPYRYVWGVGAGDERLARADRQATYLERRRPRPGRARPLPRRARVRRPRRAARTRTTACSSRSSSTPTRDLLPARPRRPRLSELAHAEAPHHIPFGFHGQFAKV